MTSLRGFKLPILLAIFLALLSIGMVSPRPAAAQLFGAGCACVANDLSCTCIDQKLEQRLKQVILGQGAISAPTGPAEQLKYFKDATNSPETLGGYSSLTGYFENVWWPRYIKLNKIIGQEDGNKAAMDMANLSRQNSAGDMIDYQNRVNTANWDNMKDYLGGEEVLCGDASMVQSFTVLDVLARMAVVQADQAAVLKRSGDASAAGPIASNGPTEYAFKAIQETIGLGTCAKGGNAGANEKWCTQSQPHLQGLHMMATTLLGQTTLSTDKNKPNNMTYAGVFLSRLFPNYFSPIRPDLLNPLSEKAAEVVLQQEAYNAGLSVFEYPYKKVIAENTPQSGISAQKYLEAVLDRMDMPKEVQDDIKGKDGISKAGADRVYYLEYMRDPKTILDKGTWNPENVQRMMAVTNMNQVTLLYEIREEIKNTNALLGALGSMLTRDLYNTVQGQTSAIAAQ